jgi:hypothetical protein
LADLDPGKLEQLPTSNYPTRPHSPVEYHEDDDQDQTPQVGVEMELSHDFDPNDPFQ